MEEFREFSIWRVVAIKTAPNQLVTNESFVLHVAATNLDDAAAMARQLLPQIVGEKWAVDQIKHDGRVFVREPQVDF